MNMRRLFARVEHSIGEGTQWAVCEPYDEPRFRRLDVRAPPDAEFGVARRSGEEGRMELAGFAVADEHVLDLVGMLRDAGYVETAERLKWAVRYGDELIGLRIADRLAILDVLDDAPDGLTELRGVLTSEHRWRVRHRLV